jgi:hypothetical protein
LERHLLKLTDFSETDTRLDCNVQVDVGEIFSWIVKFRKSGVIVNNRYHNYVMLPKSRLLM